jgi:hypothetical protein
MWIVNLALARPYTFIVLAVLILIAAPVVILNTPTDVFFPRINSRGLPRRFNVPSFFRYAVMAVARKV